MSELNPRQKGSRSSGSNSKMADISPQLRNIDIDTSPPRRPGAIPSPSSNSSRDSRIMYAERYGLTPSMSNLADMDDEDDSDDDQPLRPMVPPKDNASDTMGRRGSRPLSVRNLAPITSARPAVFVKPAPQQAPNIGSAPSDMQYTLRLYDSFNQKVYFEGYLQKMNDLAVDGKPVPDRQWTNWYVELCGPVLTIWDASNVIQNSETGETEVTCEDSISPTYINITDSVVDVVGTFQYATPPRENVFVLNSAGSNRFYLQASNAHVMNRWVCAIRLACFETSKLHEIYTRNLLSRSLWSDILEKQSGKVEGWIQARLGGATEWQRYWVVVTDKRDEKRLFGKKSIASRGQLMFYETKKSKVPIITIVNVVCAYAVYPENPKLIDLGTILKVEGSMYSSTTNDHQSGSATAFALLMTSSSKEMVQWLIGIYDAFKLYGRPEMLLSDSSNINSLNFAEPVFGRQSQLFLEVGEIEHINVQNETLLDSKIAFAGVLRSKLEHQNRMPLPPPHMSGRTNSMPLLSNVSAPQDFASRSQTTSESPHIAPVPSHSTTHIRSSTFMVSPPQVPSPSTGLGNGMKGGARNGTRYVADSSDESDNGKEDDEEEEESDDDTIFRKIAPSIATHSLGSMPSSPKSPIESQLLNVSGFGEPFSISMTPHNLSEVDLQEPSPPPMSPHIAGLKVINDTPPSYSNVQETPAVPSHANRELRPEAQPQSEVPVVVHSMSALHINPPKAASVDSGEQMTRQAVLNATARVLESGSSSKGSSNNSVASSNRYAKKKKPVSSLSGSEADTGNDVISNASYQESEDMAPLGAPNPSFSYQKAPRDVMTPPQQHGNMKVSPSMYGSDYDQQRQMWDSQSMMNQSDMYYGNEDMQSQAGGMYPGRMPMYPRGFFPDDDNRSMYSNMQGGAEGPSIPMLGDNFARQNSLLDMYHHEQMTAREQTEFAKATGQPLIHVPNKPPEPSTGLLGLITQREQDKKDGNKAKERISMMQAELDRERTMERERERRMMEQRQQQFLQAVSTFDRKLK